MGVRDLFVRAKTYVQAIDLVPLLPESRKCVLEAINSINYSYKPGKPNLNVEEYYLEYLKYNVMPNTQKEYKKCFFVLLDWLLLHQSQVQCGCILIFRQDPNFQVADLKRCAFGSKEFREIHFNAAKKINPQKYCKNIICNRHPENDRRWQREYSEGIQISIDCDSKPMSMWDGFSDINTKSLSQKNCPGGS